MQARWFSLMFSLAGVCVIAALDSTLLFSLPFAVDIGVALLSSRRPRLFWFYALLVSACSVAGAATTYYLGRRIEEAGLERFVPSGRLRKVRAQLKDKGAIAMAALDLIPPPFPFTAIILAAGALEVNTVHFFVAMFGFRVIRFGAVAALAAVYGPQIVGWMESEVFRDIAYVFITLLIAASVLSIIQFIRNVRRRRRPDTTIAA
jgi:membrane protein YqaA with SNARE-associated domain